MSCKVSIIVPVYNVEKYLHKCLSSLINQTLKDIEIIVINDGSTDNSSQIIEEFVQKDTRIKAIKQENSKLGATRNNGIKLATGEYIGFVDSDDYVDENFFEELYNTAKKYNADIVSTNILKHKPKFCKYNIKYNEYKTTTNIQDKIKLCSDTKKRFFSCWNKIYKRDLINSNNIIFTENKLHEDVLFSLSALYFSKTLAVTPNTKYHYMQNPSSICNTKKGTNDRNIDRYYIYKQLEILADKYNIELPERLNYYKSFWSTPIIKSYQGYYKTKELLFDLIPINKTLSKIFKIIFSTRTCANSKYSFIFMGLKLSIPKLKTFKKLKNTPFLKYKEMNTDITTLPKSEGQIRDIQLANLELLKEMDYVCKKNNLEYWIDFGTLIGAIRHKGFIPWDDDIDTSMRRDDYEKFINAFEKTTRNHDFYAEYHRGDKDPNKSFYIKIKHKKCPNLFVDIFPVDIYGKNLSKEEQIEETKNIKSLRNKELRTICHLLLSDNEIISCINKLRDKILFKNQENEKTDLVWGLDFNHAWKNWFSAYDVIYPLKTIQFENIEFPCINNPDVYLSKIYGNYMDYPSKIAFGHSAYAELSIEEKETIKELIPKE